MRCKQKHQEISTHNQLRRIVVTMIYRRHCGGSRSQRIASIATQDMVSLLPSWPESSVHITVHSVSVCQWCGVYRVALYPVIYSAGLTARQMNDDKCPASISRNYAGTHVTRSSWSAHYLAPLTNHREYRHPALLTTPTPPGMTQSTRTFWTY